MENNPDKLFRKFLASDVIQNDPHLTSILSEWHSRDNIAIYVPNFYNQTFEYVGPQVALIAGYEASELMARGVAWFVRRTIPEDLPKLNARQFMYSQEIQSPSFDPKRIVVQEYHWASLGEDGAHYPLVGIGVVVTFTERKEFEVGVGFLLKDEPGNREIMSEGMEALVKIKERHNQIYSHSNGKNNGPYVTQFSDTVYQKISDREREILRLLALGLSTKEAAERLGITVHTIETHRKHLLEKFDAKNSAELIKKASKIFWLE
jgi:two-component system response regulator NreC